MNYGVKITASFLLISLAIFSHAGYLDDWTDDQICGWMENPSPPEYIVEEAVKRNLNCEPELATKKAQEDTGLQIMIYDADFSQSDLEELSSETLKTDFDFSEFKIANNHRNLECQFYLEEVMHDQTGPWTIAEGDLIIDSGEVKIDVDKEGSRWRRGGLSTDPKYLRDEVNLRLTEDGYLVGKMAYFEWVGDGELPKSPIYPRLLKHKKSIPLNYKNLTTGSAKFWLEKTLDWSDGVLYLTNCTMYEENYKDGKLDGKRTTWHENGQIKSEENFKDGKKEGKSTAWYQSGQKKSELNYKNGKKEGKSTAWYQNGQIVREINYKNGKKEGKYSTWHQNGQIKSEENFKDGKSDGNKTIWYQNGQKSSEKNYEDNKETTWYQSGEIKSEVHYKNSKRHGKETTWYENGQKKSEEDYINNKREGKRTIWYENGQVMYKDNFKDGKLDGTKTNWHENGQKKSVSNYKDGKLILTE